MDFTEFKENVIKRSEYCKDIAWSFSAPMTPNLFMLCAKYGSRIAEKIKEQEKNKVVLIPEKTLLQSGFYGYVEELGAICFKNNIYVTDIILPNTIIRFHKGQFEGCSNLRRITIPRSITEIPVNCFAGCNKLEDVYYEGSINEWENNVSVTTHRCVVCDEARVIHRKNGELFVKARNPDVVKERDYGNELLLNAKIHFDCDFAKHIEGKVKSIAYAWSGAGSEFLDSPPHARCSTRIGKSETSMTFSEK